MDKKAKDFLLRILQTPSPSGFERPLQREVRRYLDGIAETIQVDLYGNLVTSINSKASRRVLLSGHADQIGYIVRHISKDGFITLSRLGGTDVGVLPGSALTIHNAKGPVLGVAGRKPLHLQSSEERDRMKLDIDKLWLDIGAASQKHAERMVSIGDPVTHELIVRDMGNGLICSPGLDDKVGVFVAIETLRRCAKRKLSVALFSSSTVQEELGCRGIKTAAYAVDPEIGIAIDVVHAFDNPAVDSYKGPPCALGKGPAISRGPGSNPVLEEYVRSVAQKQKIPTQMDLKERPPSNESREIQVSRAGVATLSIGIPNRYMHTQIEMCSLHDIEHAVDLLEASICGIKNGQDFRPL